MNTEWQIQKRSAQCLGCRRLFTDEEVLHCLLQMEGELPLRKDYCQPCWEGLKNAPEPKPAGAFSYWQSRYRVPSPPVKVEPVKRDLVEVLLKKYLSSEKVEHRNLCYILGVMLERKKIISQKESITGPSGARLLVYEHNKTGETFVVVDPGLKLSEIPAVQFQVKALLDAELEPKLS